MNTGLSFKTIVFVCIAVLTFSIAGIHARVSAVKSDEAELVLQKPLKEINAVTATYEDQKPIEINVIKAEAVDKPEKVQTAIPISGTAPQKDLQDKQVQENKEPVIVMASVDTKAMNKIERQMDSVNVQPSENPASVKDTTENIVLTQNETAEDPNLNSDIISNKAISNVTHEEAASDTKKEDIDSAIADLNRQIELNGSDAELYILRGNLHMDKQNYEQAVNDYTKAIEINPDNVTAYNYRGLAYVNVGKHKQAIKDFKKAIRIDPENIYAYINRGNAYFAKQSYRRAIYDYTKAIKIDPQFSLAYINRGITCLDESNFSNAIKDFSKALELNNKDAGTYLLRGNAYYSDGEFRQAINDYSKALEINPDLINSYNNRGMAYEAMGELDKAIYDYSKAIEIIYERPDAFINPIFYSKVGQDLNSLIINSTSSISNNSNYNYKYREIYGNTSPHIRLGHTPLPLALFQSFISEYMVVESFASYINRGLAYEKKGQLDKAISDFSRVIEIAPNYALAYLYRSKIYRKMGNEVEYKNDLNMIKKYSYEYYDLYGSIPQGYWEGSRDAPYYLQEENSKIRSK